MATRQHSQKSVDRDNGDYDYSDDFVSDADSDQRDYRAARKSHKLSRSHNHNRKISLKKRGQVPACPPQSNYIAQRMLSAGRIKMNELQNHLEEANLKIKDLLAENKILKKMQFRHEKALRHFQDKEGNLPQMLTKHANEVRALREQLKIVKEKYEKTERYLRDAEDDLERAQNKLKKYKQLVEEKNLIDRDELQKKLSKSEIDLEEKNTRIKELERHIEHLTKNHRHELGIEMASHRETKKQLQEYKEENENLKNKIKEKEKELEIKNIYSNRVMRPPHKLPSSYAGTPSHSSPHGGVLKRAPSFTDLSSRDKAKLYEKKRREERHINRQDKMQKETVMMHSKSESETDYFQKQQAFLDLDMDDNYVKDQEIKEKENWNLDDFELKQLQNRDGSDGELKLRRKIKQESEDYNKYHLEQIEQKKREEQKREIVERKMKETTEREQERIYRENREIVERERKEREENNRKHKEENDKKAREDRDRKAKEEQKIKEANLRREQEDKIKNDLAYQEEREKKDLLLARMKAIDEGIASSGSEKSSPSPSRKQYHHTQPIKNLHVGKPAYDDTGFHSRSKKNTPDPSIIQEAYQPSFSSPNRKTDQVKKEHLMESLFGSPNSTEKQNSSSDLFTALESASKTSTKKKQLLPWEHKNQGDQSNKGESHRENSSTMLFAGGAAFLEDDKSSDFSSTKLLPRRPRGPVSTLHNKPSVSAVDSIDDDIEEVII